MRITFLLPCYPWTPMGGFRVVYEYANCLAARGHDISVVHAHQLGNALPGPPANVYRWLRRKGAGLRDWLFRPDLRWQPIDRRIRILYVPDLTADHVPDADVVFATLWATAERVLELPKRKGEKFYLIQHCEEWVGPKDRVDAVWRSCLHKVVVSSWIYDTTTQMGLTDIVKIANGIDHSRLTVLTPVPERPKSVAMMFSQTEWKGSADGIAALEAAKAKHPDLQAVLFGVSPRPKQLPAWMEYRHNPPQRVIVRDIYNSARIFLCPSWAEGFALPPAEAMACGCAVASTDCGGNRDYAEHAVTALLSPPRHPEALAANLIRLLEDDDLRVSIATEGHRRIQSFTWEHSTDLMESYIEKCICEREVVNFSEEEGIPQLRSSASQ